MSKAVALRPSYWASVSGGKDSLYMLNLILHNQDKYPLSGVIHYELEIDFPFIKDVIDYMEAECQRFGIPFLRVKPTRTWDELIEKWGFPTRLKRWCNSSYKLSAQREHERYMKSLGYNVISYIGYCVDEEKRYQKRIDRLGERYPLVEENVREDTILEWAKKEPIFNHFYETHRRCGCMYCPLASYMDRAYLAKYYPDKFEYMIAKMQEADDKWRQRYEAGLVEHNLPPFDAEYIRRNTLNKWVPKLEEAERRAALELFNKVEPHEQLSIDFDTEATE